jgi:photosystem II stability/assembly factor-like uncharacterized protein
MKKFISFISFFFCISGFLSAQWSQYNLPYNGIAYRMNFYDLNNGISTGLTYNNYSGRIYYTTNSGANWLSSVYPQDLRAITCVQYINSSTVYACGAQNNFSDKIFSTNFPNFFNLNNNRNYLKGIIPGWEYYKGVLLKSTNAGINWSKVGRLDSLSGYINGIHFFDANTGYAVIDTNPSGYPKFCKTTNGGVNWQKLFKLDSNFFTENINFINLNTGFFSGYIFGLGNSGGSIYKTTNGGINWTQKRFGFTNDIFEISFFNSNTGVAIGAPNNGTIGTKVFRTTNTGSTWDSVFYYPNYLPQFIKTLGGTGISLSALYHMNDTSTGFSGMSTIKSTDYGLTWTAKTYTVNKLFVDGKLIDPNNFFLSGGDVGTSAVILKSTNGGGVFVNKISEEIPEKMFLYQNYPNPFNPVTKIRYEVPKAGQVSIKVYDVLGKEITVLVRENLSPGIYEAEFDGSSYSSGIYYYRIFCNGNTDTKKMMMIK